MTTTPDPASIPGADDSERASGSCRYSGNGGEFVGRDGLLTRKFAEAIQEAGPIRSGLDGQLWHYRDGVWLPGAKVEVGRRAKLLLGDKWRGAHIDNVASWFAAEDPFIRDEHPTGVINTRSGLLDWRTGTLGDHDPTIPSTFQVPHVWDPSATCPTVDRWLLQVLPKEVVPLMWELFGYALYPDNPFHVAVVLHGSGRNGKGTLLRLIERLLGAQHVSAVTLEKLAESRWATGQLYRKVANLVGDMENYHMARTAKFKSATGGDLLDAEAKFGAPFSFRCRTTFVFGANVLPFTSDTSAGLLSRWLIIPVTKGYFPTGVAKPEIEAQLHAELPGVLVRAVAGLRDLMERGSFLRPEPVVTATDEFKDKVDPIRIFVRECLALDPTAAEARATVCERYEAWCKSRHEQALCRAEFYRQIESQPGVTSVKRQGTRTLTGVRITGTATSMAGVGAA